MDNNECSTLSSLLPLPTPSTNEDTEINTTITTNTSTVTPIATVPTPTATPTPTTPTPTTTTSFPILDELLLDLDGTSPIDSPNMHNTLTKKELTPEMIALCIKKVEKLLLYDNSNELMHRLEHLIEKRKKILAELSQKVTKPSSPKSLRLAREFIVKAHRSKQVGLKEEAIENLKKAANLLPLEKQHAILLRVEKLKREL
eukprot:TRINITY_DN445_c0_g1_i1.p2 TRINITY_DN445_c0_g1~~TRINITY_DN445_c0_g1_i1.p2  ORF type:complete len:201 (+),score=60.89 TRINITY_DN445_c0_g1_i1:289-891(+)